MRFIYVLVILLISAVVVAFALSNRNLVTINFFFTDLVIELPVFMLFFSALLLGVVLSFLINLKQIIRNKMELMDSKKRVKVLENELASIKTSSKI